MKARKRLKQTFVALSISLLITGFIPCIPVATNYPVVVEAATNVKISKTKITLDKGKVTAKVTGTALITAAVSGKRYI